MDSYGTHKSRDTKPFVWAATADLTLGKIEPFCEQIYIAQYQGMDPEPNVRHSPEA
jgi:hypothetical protein